MPFLRYADSCASIAGELKCLLTGDEYEDVYAEIGRFSYAEWHAWRIEQRPEIEKLAVAIPSKRKKLLAAQPRQKMLLLVFAACQYCYEAEELLATVARHCRPGLSYRAMLSAAHAALREVDDGDRSLWPWDDVPAYKDFHQKPTGTK
jgi:hypothetical protein